MSPVYLAPHRVMRRGHREDKQLHSKMEGEAAGDGERGGKEMKDAYFYIQHDPLNPYKLTVDLPDRSEGVVALLTK